jgi:predicted dehydrogenase
MIRAAVIGTGNISGVHLGYLRTRRDVTVAALCDIREEALGRRRREFGGDGYADYTRMLDEAKPDAVWICTPPTVRRGPLLACAERGIPVFCEKPAERSLARARGITEELEKRKARVQVGYVFRSMPIVRSLVKAIRDDRIHTVSSFYGCSVSLGMSLPPWFYDKTLSGGALVDQATHNLDLLRMLMGEAAVLRGVASNPVHGKKKGYTIDEAIGLSFVFESGAVGGHVHTWVGDAWRNEMTLIGEKRLYRIDLGKGTLSITGTGAPRMATQDQARMYWHENERFLSMVKSGDWKDNPSGYADAARTLRLTLECDRALAFRK